MSESEKMCNNTVTKDPTSVLKATIEKQDAFCNNTF